MSEAIKFAQFEVELDPAGKPIELGRGGMGVTYKAFDTRLRRPVVLKVIRDGLLNDDTASKRFLREARSAARIQHPNIATVFDQGQEGTTFFYAMEYIEGETLQSMIRREGTLPPRVALEVTLQVTKALQAAWAEKVIHRDIKPPNIMLVKDKHGGDDMFVKLIDFGLAKGAVGTGGKGDGDGTVTITQDGGLTAGFVGTPHFASPEQIEPSDELDIRSDIYSLGVTLWYALHGSPPFGGTSFVRVASQHLSKPPPFQELTEAPPPVITLLKRMLAKDREDRPTDPTELRREIEAAIRALDSGAVAPTLPNLLGAPGLPNVPARPAPPLWPPAVGTVLAGRYKIEQLVGEDLTGKLYRATDQGAGGAPMAIRALRAGLLEKPAAMERFQQSAQGIARLAQPGLIGGVTLQQTEGGRFVTMEWLESRTFLDVLRARGGSLPPNEVQAMLAQAGAVCEAATHAEMDDLELTLGTVHLHLPDGPPAAGWPALLSQPLVTWPRWQVKLGALDLSAADAEPVQEAEAAMMTIIPGAVSARDLAKPLGQRYTQRLAALAYELLGGAPHRIDPERLLVSGYTSISAVGEEANAVLRRALRPGPGEAMTSPAQFTAALAAASPRRAPTAPLTPPPTAPPPFATPPVQPVAYTPAPAPRAVAPPPSALPPVLQPQAYVAPQPQAYVAPQPQAQYVPQVPPAQRGPQPGAAKQNPLLLWGGIAAGVVVLGTVGYLVSGKKKDDVGPNTPTPTPSLVAQAPTPTPTTKMPTNLSGDDQRAAEGMPAAAVVAYQAVRKSESSPARTWLRVADDYRKGSRPMEAAKCYERAIQLEEGLAEAQAKLGYANLLLARLGESERAARRATVLDSNLPEGWRVLGICAYLKLDYVEAADSFRKAVAAAERAPRSGANYEVWGDSQGRLALVQNADEGKASLAKAADILQRGTEAFPSDAVVWQRLGGVLGRSNHIDRANDAYQRALRISPESVEALADLGLAFIEAKQQAKGTDLIQRALKINPDYVIAWLNLGYGYSGLKEYAKAVDAYQQAVTRAPDFVFALEGLGESLTKSGQARRALEPLQKATQLMPNYGGPWKSLCDAYRRLGENAKAIDAGQRAVQHAPYFADAHEMLGAAYFVSNQVDKAIPSYQRAVELNPQSGSAWNRLGFALTRAKQIDKGFEAYQKAVQVDPESYEAWDNLGDYYRGKGQNQPAIESYQKCVRINPNFAIGWNDLGYVLNDVNQDPAALDAYNKAVALDPNYASAWNNIGFTYAKVGPVEKAIEPLQKALKIEPKYVVAWANLGAAYTKLNRFDEAIEAHKKAVEFKPDSTFSWKELATLYDRKGQTELARQARRNAETPPRGGVAPPPKPTPSKSDFDEMLRKMEQMGDKMK